MRTNKAIPLCFSCLRYGTIPYMDDCPELERWSEQRPNHIQKKQANKCSAFRSKKNILVAWGVKT